MDLNIHQANEAWAQFLSVQSLVTKKIYKNVKGIGLTVNGLKVNVDTVTNEEICGLWRVVDEPTKTGDRKMEYKFKAWQPFEGERYQTIAIEDDFEAIMWGLNNQVDIYTQDGKLVYSSNDDEEINFERLEKYGVQCIDDENGRSWVRIPFQYFEFLNPYHALIKARNEMEAARIYIDEVAGDESELEELTLEAKVVSEVYAAVRMARGTNEDGSLMDMNFVFAQLERNEPMAVLWDSSLT